MPDAWTRLARANRIGLLFTGGAACCTFQIGVAETLLAAGIRPSLCLGVSGGAWNAAAVATGTWERLRSHWRYFCRVPPLDLRHMVRDRTPFVWRRLHHRAFRRYIGVERVRAAGTLPLFIGVTRMGMCEGGDRSPMFAGLISAVVESPVPSTRWLLLHAL